MRVSPFQFCRRRLFIFGFPVFFVVVGYRIASDVAGTTGLAFFPLAFAGGAIVHAPYAHPAGNKPIFVAETVL